MGRGMEMEGWGRVVKILMFIANFVIWVGSIIILVFGIWAVVDRPFMETILGGSIYRSAASILIAVGVLAFIISFLGCFGALKEIKGMLVLYFIIVLILFAILLVGGILGLVYHGKAESEIMMQMTKSLKEYHVNRETAIKHAWDDAQRSMKCCGVDSYANWRQLNGEFKGSRKVPESCCFLQDTGEPVRCSDNPNRSNAYVDRGCFYVSKEFIMEHAKYIGGAGIAVALFMIFGLIFSLILFLAIR